MTVSYTNSGKVQYEILQNRYELYDTLYTENVTYVVLVKWKQSDFFLKKIIDITGNNVEIKEEEPFYGVWINDKLEIV